MRFFKHSVSSLLFLSNLHKNKILFQDVDEKVYQPHNAVAKNKNYWVNMKNILEERGKKDRIDIMDIFDDEQLEIDVANLTDS